MVDVSGRFIPRVVDDDWASQRTKQISRQALQTERMLKAHLLSLQSEYDSIMADMAKLAEQRADAEKRLSALESADAAAGAPVTAIRMADGSIRTISKRQDAHQVRPDAGETGQDRADAIMRRIWG